MLNFELELPTQNKSEIKNILNQLEDFDQKPSRLTLVDKKKDEYNLDSLRYLKQNIDSAIDIMPHYSVQMHYSRDLAEVVKKFVFYLNQMKELGIDKVLLVSGPKDYNNGSIDVLRVISTKYKELANDVSFAVAFNPYLSGKKLKEEKARLEKKLSFDLTKEVYFQIGVDTAKFKQGVEFTKNIRSDVAIKPSLMIPTQKFLSSFRANPWRGVNLDDDYLKNINKAKDQTKKIYSCMKQENISPLVEIFSAKEKVLEKSFNLLQNIQKDQETRN